LGEINRYFEEVTALAATRGAGQLYADRSLIYEETMRNFASFTLGGTLQQHLQSWAK